MKKNISINISGIIFHIEEDGFDKLKNYLDSINRYFSTFDDSHEIIADIEGRIAEIFLSKLKDGRQVISLEDVESLITTMGSVRDFQAIEEEMEYPKEEKQKVFEAPPVPEPRKIYRDGKRKILGGVLSGIAHYLNIDPLWIRLIYLLLFFGISFLESIGPILFLVYIVLWIVFPVSYDLEEEEKLKKMYRDPDGKVLGGVCSGISAYFGIDVIVVRLLFVISIFFVGTGVILYIILWLILPEAITITDKMKMKGQPVTLQNIEINIKKSFNVNEGEENIFIKILLFPFRMLGIVFDFLNKAIGPLLKFVVEAVRIFVGVILLITGMALIASAVVALGTVLGFTNFGFTHLNRFPMYLLENDFNWVDVTALFFTLIIPFVFLAILGLVTIAKRKLLTATIGWSLVGLWILSVAVIGFKLPFLIVDFTDEGYYTTEQSYDVKDKTLVLKIRDAGQELYQSVDLNIKDSEDGALKLVQEFKARGSDMLVAEENAKMVDYRVSQNDSVLIFDSNLSFKDDARFRVQELYMTLHVPEGQKFKIDREMSYILGNYFRRKGFSSYDLQEKSWYFEKGELKCEGCTADAVGRRREREEKRQDTPISDREFSFDNFSDLDIRGDFNIKISQADEFHISLKDSEPGLDKISVEKRGKKLTIARDGTDFVSSNDNAQIEILMPDLNQVVLSGSSKATIYGFSNDNLKIETRETSQIDFDSNIKMLEVMAAGSSSVELFGKGERLRIKTENASKVNASDYYVDRAFIDSSGASEVKVYGEDRIEINAGDGSKVEYRGNARVEVERKHDARVEKK